MINDLGRYPVTLNPADKYTFKVPSLRNLRFTAPYMHDGRLLTIESVSTIMPAAFGIWKTWTPVEYRHISGHRFVIRRTATTPGFSRKP